MGFKIDKSEITKEKLLEIEDFNKETKERIKNSDILIVPNFWFKKGKKRCFYAATSDFYKLAKQELKGNTISLCENEGKEKSLALHHNEIWIPILLISINPLKDVLLPTLINFVTNYISYKLGKNAKKDESKVHLQIVVEDNKRKISKSLKYDGKIAGLKELNIKAKDLFK